MLDKLRARAARHPNLTLALITLAALAPFLAKPFNLHDVGTGDSPDEKIGPKYDTPTLLGVYRVNSYLHDGRAKTLLDVLTTCNHGDRHGVTSHLKKEELADLVAFLKSLPYEPPPEDTPNTVEHRVKLKPVTEPK